MNYYNRKYLAKICGVTHQTIHNWVQSGWLIPHHYDEFGNMLFSQEQVDILNSILPVPKQTARKEWLAKLNIHDCYYMQKEITNADLIVPPSNPLYRVDDKAESAKKISTILEKSNMLLFESLERPKTNVDDIDELIESTKGYFEFCRMQGIMPSFRRLANWYGYSHRMLYKKIQKETPSGIYLDRIKDAIKDNLEQAALVNAVNNISAMFILKSQYDYVETQKVVVEPTNVLGTPKTDEEIIESIDYDIVDE